MDSDTRCVLGASSVSFCQHQEVQMRSTQLYGATLLIMALGLTLTEPAQATNNDPAEPTPQPTGWAFGADSWCAADSWYHFDNELPPLAIATAGFVVGIPGVLHQTTTKNIAPDAPRAWHAGWNYASYLSVAGAISIGIAHYSLRADTLADSKFSRPYEAALPVLFSDIEAVGIGSGVTAITKTSVGRCRPYAWHDGQCDAGNDDNYAAFPSGHTMIPAALAGVHLVEVVRDSRDPVNWFSFIGLELAAVSTGVMRVKAGAHSWSDVIGGYTLGHLSGVLVNAAHPRARAKDPAHSIERANARLQFDGRVLALTADF